MTDCRQRWVLLHHQVENLPVSGGGLGRGDHYDLMLSPLGAGQLWTWAIPINPLCQPLPFECDVDRLSDHRRVYLDYQGAVSGDRGQVHQVAKGTFEVVVWSEQEVKVWLRLDEVQHHFEDAAEPKNSFLISLTCQPSAWHLNLSAIG